MTKVKPVTPRLAKYIDYINNTAQVPLPVEDFDEDWEPIGPMVRAELEHEGYIYMGGMGCVFEQPEGMYLRPDLSRKNRT